jgi:hypothetical protein
MPIVEHLRGLSQLADEDFLFFAVPVKVKNRPNSTALGVAAILS